MILSVNTNLYCSKRFTGFELKNWGVHTENGKFYRSTFWPKSTLNLQAKMYFKSRSPSLKNPNDQMVRGNINSKVFWYFRSSCRCQVNKATLPQYNLPAVVELEWTRCRHSIRRTGWDHVSGWDGAGTLLAPPYLAQPQRKLYQGTRLQLSVTVVVQPLWLSALWVGPASAPRYHRLHRFWLCSCHNQRRREEIARTWLEHLQQYLLQLIFVLRPF